MTQGFIGSVRTGQPKTFNLKTCTRDLRSLGLLVDPSENSAWDKGVDIDQLMVIKPVEHVEPEAPVEPVDPVPVEHVEPEAPVEPVDPVPVEPVDPVDPVEPVEPVEPVNPVKIVEPAATAITTRTPPATTTKADTRPRRTR